LGWLGDLILSLETALGVPFAFILMAAVFVLFCWLSLSFYKSNKQIKNDYEKEIRELKPGLQELADRQRQTSEAFNRFLQLLETRYGQLAGPERRPELPATRLGALPNVQTNEASPSLLQGIDLDIPLHLKGGTLLQVTIQGDHRVARYAFPSPETPGGYIYKDLIINIKRPLGDSETL
jgi:hypothetical protein